MNLYVLELIVHCYYCMKIAESFKKFGLSTDSNAVIVAVIDAETEENSQKVSIIMINYLRFLCYIIQVNLGTVHMLYCVKIRLNTCIV